VPLTNTVGKETPFQTTWESRRKPDPFTVMITTVLPVLIVEGEIEVSETATKLQFPQPEGNAKSIRNPISAGTAFLLTPRSLR